MMVNEAANQLVSGGARSGTYAAVPTGSGSVALPVVANNDAAGFTSGLTVFNTSNQAVNGSIQYYNADGTTQGNSQPFSVGGGSGGNLPNHLPAHASQPYYPGITTQPAIRV